MGWIQIPLAVLATAAVSEAHASERPTPTNNSQARNELGQNSPLEELLRFFGETPIRVVARERDGSDPDTVECCKES